MFNTIVFYSMSVRVAWNLVTLGPGWGPTKALKLNYLIVLLEIFLMLEADIKKSYN